MTTIAPPTFIVGAARQPLPFGLFSTFTLRPPGDHRWLNGVSFQSITCDSLSGVGVGCADPTGLPKSLERNAEFAQPTVPFTVYGHYACAPMGATFEEASALALQHLEAREEARVEEAFWTGNLDNEPSLASGDVTVLADGDPVAPAVGLGLLEGWIAKTYGSLGVIHMTRALAGASSDHLKAQGNVLRTVLGTPVAAGAGYPGTDGSVVDPDGLQSWAYVTPALFGYRSDVATSSSRPYDLLDRGDNTLYAIAERSYVLGFDPCGLAAVLIDPTL